MSIENAAPRLGVTKNTLLSYEQDKTQPDLQFLALLALRCDADFTVAVTLRLKADRHPDVAKSASKLTIETLKLGEKATGHLVVTLKKYLLAQVIRAVEASDLRAIKDVDRKAEIIAKIYDAAHGYEALSSEFLDKAVELVLAGEG